MDQQGRQADLLQDALASAHNRLRDALREATLGEFEIYDELGKGGMATVFLGYDIALDRHVAIKVMAPSLLLEDGMAERFRREARIVAGLSHPHIIPVYGVRQTEQLSFFVMKYIDGSTLDFVIREHAPLPTDMIQVLLAQVGSALAYAHKRGIVHRDVKPANIMIDADGWAVVTDFGIARASGLSGLTATGASVGTPYYMSPEQCSQDQITGQSDQYALGVVAYQMLCGGVPFGGSGIGEVMRAHIMDIPEPVLKRRPDCPPALAHIVMRMLSKNPEDRWASLDAVVAELKLHPTESGDPIRSQLITLARSGARQVPLPSPPTSPAPSSRRIAKAVPPVSKPSFWRSRSVRRAFLSFLVLAVGALGLWKWAGAPPISEVLPDSTVTRVPESPPQPAAPAPPAVAEDKRARPGAGNAATPPRDQRSRVTPNQAGSALVVPPPPAPVTAVAAGSSVTQPADTATRAPAEASNWAWVRLGTRQEESVLYINGIPRLPRNPSIRWWRVPAGKVTFSLQAEGCTPWQDSTVLKGGDSVSIGNRFPTCPSP